MITLLSPAKLMNMDGDSWEGAAEPLFQEKADQLVGKLRRTSVAGMRKLMSLSPDLARMNVQRYVNWEGSDVPKKSAALAFNGEVYRGLNAKEWGEADLLFAQDHVRMLSGLYGLLKPNDYIKAYRLEMGCGYAYGKAKNLYEYWRKPLTKALNEALSEHPNKVILNCASNEYTKVVDKKALKSDWLDVSFKERKGDDYKVVMVYAKQARGAMANFVVREKIDNPEHIKAFDVDGYLFNQGLSSDNHMVFTRG